MTIPIGGVPLNEHREWFRELVDLGYTDLWSSESGGYDGFTPLALAAAWAPEMRLGIAIIPAFTRGPALLAMSAASLAEAAPGRFVMGIGSSSDEIVDDLIIHGSPDDCREHVARYVDAGVDTPVLAIVHADDMRQTIRDLAPQRA